MDFVTNLPPSDGNTAIVTVVDSFSKMAHFMPLPKLPSAKETARWVLLHVFRLHGLPVDVVAVWGLGLWPVYPPVFSPSPTARLNRRTRRWRQRFIA